MNTEKVTASLYRQIAIDIAENIVRGRYTQGEKLFGRSVLASHYKVSPETIRKAVFLLKDVGVVETEKGSGIEIISKEKAAEFIQSSKSVNHVASIKKEVEAWARNQVDQAADILRKIQFLINETERIYAVSPLNPFQIRITPQCKVINKTASELNFWHITGGTIVAIRRSGNLIVSPGPYATFCEDDVFFVVGDDAVYSSTMKLLYG